MNEPERPARGRHAAEPGQDTERIASSVDRLYEKVGDALLAYLSLADTDPESDSLEDDFDAAYRGDHASFDEALRAQLNGLGWSDALTEMMEANGIAPGMLAWNVDMIRERMEEIYEFVEHEGRIYQFLR